MRRSGSRVAAFAVGISLASACAAGRGDQIDLQREFQEALSRVGGGISSAEEETTPRATGTGEIEFLLEPTPLRGAAGLACWENQIFVTEPYANRISVLRADGTIRRVGTPHGFRSPSDLLFAADATLYVASLAPGGIWRRNPSGAWDRIAPSLAEITGLVLSAGGNLLVAECAQGGRLLEIDPTAGLIVSVLATDLGCPGRIALDGKNRLLVPLAERGEVLSLDLHTQEQTLLEKGLDMPTAVGHTPDGARVVLEGGSGLIKPLRDPGPRGGSRPSLVKLAPGLADLVLCGSTLVTSNAATGAVHAFKPWPGRRRQLAPPGLVVPSAIALDGEDLLIADRASIKRIRHGKVELVLLARPGGMPPPAGLARGWPGRAWITSPEDGSLFEVDLARGDATRVVSGLNWPTSLLWTDRGELYIAETGGGRILQLGAGALAYTIASGLASPVALAARGRRLLVAEPEGGRILSVRKNEVATPLLSNLAAPAGLATARGRPLYFAEERRGTLLARRRGGTLHPVALDLALKTRAPMDPCHWPWPSTLMGPFSSLPPKMAA